MHVNHIMDSISERVNTSVLLASLILYLFQKLKRLVDEMEVMWEGADAELREAYGREHLEEQRNGLYKAPENCALSLEPVLCALEDAIVSENPAIRYLVDGGRGLLDWHNVSVKRNCIFLEP